MTFTKKNEEAVSPVIGVILMVAITVILAAVIAAFVFGMAGNIQSSKTVAVTLQRVSTDTVGVTFVGGQDAASVSTVSYLRGTSGSATTLWDATPAVGTTKTLGAVTGEHIIVRATFNDGTTQVLMDKIV